MNPRSFSPGLIVIVVASLATPLSIYASPRDLDEDGRPNIRDRDVDNDGLPNRRDRNVDGGRARRGPLKGRYVGDRLRNDDPAEKDIDGDGFNDDSDSEKDIDGDGLEDDSDLDDDGNGTEDDDDLDDDGDGTEDDDEIVAVPSGRVGRDYAPSSLTGIA